MSVAVKWMGCFLDPSGYAEANRNYVAALHSVGVDVSCQLVSFDKTRTDYGKAGEICKSLIGKQNNAKIKVIFLTPEHYPIYREKDKYNIGLFVLETDRLPDEWVKACNSSLDEIWTASEWNKEVFINSGIKRPVYVFPHCFNPEEYKNVNNFVIDGLDSNWFKFYSIFQWSERKNPVGLLKAYLTEFTADDPVVLILKTYGSNFSPQEVLQMKNRIKGVRDDIGNKNSQPKILLLSDSLRRDQILGLHKAGDCFVLINKAEGWGLPHFEACAMGKPVITTNYGACKEFCKPEHSYLVDWQPTPVTGMSWIKWYNSRMSWAEPNIVHTKQLMRSLFQNRQEGLINGSKAKEFISDHFSYLKVGQDIKKRLDLIIHGIN